MRIGVRTELNSDVLSSTKEKLALEPPPNYATHRAASPEVYKGAMQSNYLPVYKGEVVL